MNNERAVSEALGFVLVFSIIISMVGLAYAFGFPGLEDTRDVERVNNAERAFDVLADNIEDLSQRNAPSRATEIKLADAAINPGESVELVVSIPSRDFSVSKNVRPIVYERDDGTALRYVSGGVIRSQPAGAVMVRTMDFSITEDRALIPIIQTRTRSGGIGGSSTVLVRTERSESDSFVNATNGADVWMNVTSPNTGVWERSLESRDGIDSCSVSGDTVKCSFATDRVYVSVTKVDFTFSS